MVKDYLQLIRFDKPIGTLLLLWPTLWALFFATNGVVQFKYIIVFTLGVFLTRASGCAFNDIADSDFDKHVARTKNRPMVRGAISKTNAFIFALMLSLLAFILAMCTLSLNTILLCIPALIIYMTYPLFKRFFAIPQAYLGIAFSFGILMAFMQIQNNLGSLAWLTFLANLFWVVGYDTIYALVDIKDDVKIGMKTSAITFGRYVILVIGLCYLFFIIIMLKVGITLQLLWPYYVGCIVASLILLTQLIVLIRKIETRYFKMFLFNNWVGLFIFAGVLCSYLLSSFGKLW